MLEQLLFVAESLVVDLSKLVKHLSLEWFDFTKHIILRKLDDDAPGKEPALIFQVAWSLKAAFVSN